MDRLSVMRRSWLMSRVGSKNTLPEMTVRQVTHGLGYRYRLHRKDLPGKPDIVFGSRGKIIFVHGCYWHGHACGKGRLPKSNKAFWRAKIEANKTRDTKHIHALRKQGWKILVIWQCETKDRLALAQRIIDFLE